MNKFLIVHQSPRIASVQYVLSKITSNQPHFLPHDMLGKNLLLTAFNHLLEQTLDVIRNISMEAALEKLIYQHSTNLDELMHPNSKPR